MLSYSNRLYCSGHLKIRAKASHTYVRVFFFFFFMTRQAGNLSPPLTKGDSSWLHVHQCRGSAQALNEGELSLSPVLPALKSSMSGCPLKVGALGLARARTHMVVGSPRSYPSPRASTLAREETREPYTWC
jgi:hypothetical protein